MKYSFPQKPKNIHPDRIVYPELLRTLATVYQYGILK